MEASKQERKKRPKKYDPDEVKALKEQKKKQLHHREIVTKCQKSSSK